MLAQTAFDHRAKELEDRLAQAKTAQEAVGACVMAIEQTACELAQDEQDELARQRQQAVMAVAKRAPQMLLCTRAQGKLVVREAARDAQKWTMGAQAAGGVVLLALAAFELIDGKLLFAVLQAAGALMLAFGAKKAAPKTPDVVAEGEWAIDAQATVSRIAELMRAADICTGDLALIMQDGGGTIAGDVDEATLDLLVTLMEAKATGREAAAMRALGQAEQHLHALGIEALHYNEKNDALFDKLPTQGEARTIRPALVKDGKVIRRGVAARKEARGV